MLIRLSAFLLLTIVAVFPAGAAEVPSTLDAAKLATIKSVGIISAVGDTLNISTNGPFLRLSMSQKVRPISDMGIDDALEAFVRQKLSTRYKIEPVQYGRGQFSGVKDSGYLRKNDLPPLEKLVNSLSATVDAYLIISKDLVPFGLDEKVARPGLNIGRGGFYEDQYVADAFIKVSLIDARTSVLLAQASYPPPISRLWGGKVERLPLDGALWPDDAGNFTQLQHDELKKVLTDDLEAIVSRLVEQQGLIPAHTQQ